MADWPTTLEEARALDATDPLSAFRERFVIADPELIYLDGNSLGRLPRATGERLATVVEYEWGERLVRGWGEGWFDAPQRIGGKLAGLLGAAADEVVLADSTCRRKLCCFTSRKSWPSMVMRPAVTSRSAAAG